MFVMFVDTNMMKPKKVKLGKTFLNFGCVPTVDVIKTNIKNFNLAEKEKIMLMYANMAIDAFQSNKTTWINTFIKDESLKAPLQEFVNSQTVYTKQVVIS